MRISDWSSDVCSSDLSVVQAVRSSWQSLSPEHAAPQPSNISFKRTAPPPLNSSVRDALINEVRNSRPDGRSKTLVLLRQKDGFGGDSPPPLCRIVPNNPVFPPQKIGRAPCGERVWKDG